jgi:hypothetical protein
MPGAVVELVLGRDVGSAGAAVEAVDNLCQVASFQIYIISENEYNVTHFFKDLETILRSCATTKVL